MPFILKVMAFAKNGEGSEFYEKTDVLGEVTEVTKDGDVEIAFNTPAKERHYVTIPLADLAREALLFNHPSRAEQ